jgi:hypothetical protein
MYRVTAGAQVAGKKIFVLQVALSIVISESAS